MKIDRTTFDEQRSPRFGRANPERMRLPFWEALVRDFRHPCEFRRLFDLPERDGKPIWCFSRFGRTETVLADGRAVCVGGEYDDGGDPDFYIYNDVVILRPDTSIEIFGYPRDAFPPTDFHTASLVGDRLIIIGGLGYPEDRRQWVTPVHSLDLSSYRIEAIVTQGEPPGWIHKHEAEVDASGESITVRGGEFLEHRDGEQEFWMNLDEYRLHLVDGRWERIAGREGWRQFIIGLLDNKEGFSGWIFPYDERSIEYWSYPFKEDIFWPMGITHELSPVPESEYRRYRITVNSISILFVYNYDILRMIVEGDLPGAITERVAETIHANVEAAIGAPCYLREFRRSIVGWVATQPSGLGRDPVHSDRPEDWPC